MSYPASIAKALAYLQTADIPENYKKIAPIDRFLCQKGIIIKPAIVADFISNAIFHGISGGVGWLLASLIFTPAIESTLIRVVISPILFSIVFGCLIAWYYQRQR